MFVLVNHAVSLSPSFINSLGWAFSFSRFILSSVASDTPFFMQNLRKFNCYEVLIKDVYTLFFCAQKKVFENLYKEFENFYLLKKNCFEVCLRENFFLCNLNKTFSYLLLCETFIRIYRKQVLKKN